MNIYHKYLFVVLISSISFNQSPDFQDDFTFIFPQKGYEGTPIAFEVKPNNPNYLYVWDFGHSSQYETFNWKKIEDRAMGSNVEFTYPGQGRNNGFTVRVTIYNGKINSSNKLTVFEKFIPIENVPPSISLVNPPLEANEGEEIYFKASHIDPGAADKHVYYWNFDGNKTNGPFNSYQNSHSITNTFNDDGLFTIFSIAQDDDNDSDTIYHQIKINNLPPILEEIQHTKTGVEGQRISFKAIFSDPGLNDIHTFIWDFGDGELDTAYNNLIDHVYKDNGEFNVKLILNDNSNGSDTLFSNIKIDNIAPKIKVVIPENGDEGTPLSFSLTIKDDGSKDTHKIIWDLGDGNTYSSSSFIHSYLDNGKYTINVNVEDDDGGKDSWVQEIKIFNLPPSLEIIIPDSTYEGKVETFRVNVFDKGINDTFTYFWNFGDGESDSTKETTYKFLDNGQFKISVTVRDNDGGLATAEKTINVINISPILKAVIPKKQYEGTKVTIEASVLEDPGLNDEHVFQFNYGDGNISDISNHVYRDDGEYNIEIILFDDDGGSDTLNQLISIINLPPKIIGKLKDVGNEGENIEFQITVEDPGNDDTHKFYWDFNDGFTDSVKNTQHVFADNGVYNILLKVVDDDGGIDSINHEILVKNLPPTISASFTSSSKVQIPEQANNDDKMSTITQYIDITEDASPKESPTGDKDAVVQFNCNVSDSGKVDTHSFLWNFGDGITSDKANVNHTYTKNGVFPVSIIVIDDDKGSDTLTQTITITNITPAMAATLISPDTTFQTILIKPLESDGVKETNTYSWDFGDGDTSSYYMPTHIYNEKGEFLITSRINDKNSYTAMNFNTINVNGRSPRLIPTDSKELINDQKSDDFFSKDLFTISSPRRRTFNPNSFPTIVFTIENHSDVEKDVNLNLLLPESWEILNLIKPSSLKPNIPERIRATLKIPYNENADLIHKIKLIAKIGDYDHMVSFMSTVNINIKEKPAFLIESLKSIDSYELGKNKKIEFTITNTGNISDTYSTDFDIPFDWEITSSNEPFSLKPDESKKLFLGLNTSKNKSKISEKEISIIGFSQKLKSNAGIWYEEIMGEKAFCSDSFSAHCTIPSRPTKENCELEGVWSPSIAAQIEYCSDSLFTNQDDCVRKNEWIESVRGTPSVCTDTTYKSLSECTANNETWIAGTPDIGGYCSNKLINNKERCLKINTWYPTIRGLEGFCKSLPDRLTEDDCISMGTWNESYQGSLTEEECIAKREWYPAKQSRPESCSENYWSNKEDCESKSEWILKKESIPGFCQDDNSLSKDDCLESNWIEEVPEVEAYCLDGISKSLVECNSQGVWSPEVVESEAYCSDVKFITKEECIKLHTWTPEIEAVPAYCSDQVSLLKEDCINPPGSEKSTLITLLPTLKNPEKKTTSMYAKLPMTIGLEIGNLSTDFFPRSRFSLESPMTNLGPYKALFRYSQSYDQYPISDSTGSSNQTDKYLSNYIIDRLQLYLSRDNWTLILGDSYIDKYKLITRLSPIPIFGLNGSETFRGLQLGYQFNNFDLLLSHGTGPSFTNAYNLSTLSLSSKLTNENKSFYAVHVQNTNDSLLSNNFISIQRIDKKTNITNGQILALSSDGQNNDGTAQLFIKYKNDKFSISNRSYYFGDYFAYGNSGRIGSDFTTFFNLGKSIYNFSRIQMFNQNLFRSIPIYSSEEYNDCIFDFSCLNEQESFTDLNDNGILDIDTSYIEKVSSLKFDNKIFFNFKNGFKINFGLTYENDSYSNGYKGNYKVYEFKLMKNLGIHQPYITMDYSLNTLSNENDELERKISLGNRTIWGNLNLNFNQDVNFPTDFEPIEYLTNINGRFKFLRLNWNFIIQINNLCPICTGEREKSSIETMGLQNNFSLKFLGIENRIRLGFNYAPKLNSLNFTFGIIPSGGSRSSKIQLPIPLVNIKGRYSGEIFIDENRNNLRDSNEKGVSNLLLFINGYIAVTNEDGIFEFGSLEPGQYQLQFDKNTLDAKYKFIESFPKKVTINEGNKIFDSIPISSVCKIKGSMFVDSDLDKIKDSNEKVIDNARIIVQTSNNQEFEIYTDAEGRYEIPDLKAGNYNLIIDPDWLPERTIATYSLDSKKTFTKLGWPVLVTSEESEIKFNIPLNEEELEIRIDVQKEVNGNR